jgi:hypothetical protein
MAVHALSEHFDWFFRRINPSPTYTSIASSELNNVQALLQAADAPAAPLAPRVFAQGSYRQETAIHTINDLDVVALCTALTHPPVTTGWGGPGGRSFSRDEIFSLLASALARDHRYRGKIRYRDQSLCIKIDLSIKVEILPAVMRTGITDVDGEPFRMYRPERGEWVDGYARQHRALMSTKNAAAGGRYIPMVKVLKHLRDTWPGFDPDDAISFHLECLLYHVPNALFFGTVAHVIAQVLGWIVAFPPDRAIWSGLRSPCGDKELFSSTEWAYDAYSGFHETAKAWAAAAALAVQAADRYQAIRWWKHLLGDDYFPWSVT